jgi:hypothetical protein
MRSSSRRMQAAPSGAFPSLSPSRISASPTDCAKSLMLRKILNPNRATNLADRLDCDFALINRNRAKGDGPDAEGKMELLVGDVRNKIAILIDDMADTGSTIKTATQTLADNGAKEVYALVSHGA